MLFNLSSVKLNIITHEVLLPDFIRIFQLVSLFRELVLELQSSSFIRLIKVSLSFFQEEVADGLIKTSIFDEGSRVRIQFANFVQGTLIKLRNCAILVEVRQQRLNEENVPNLFFLTNI